jgi:micrococcal nuclease
MSAASRLRTLGAVTAAAWLCGCSGSGGPQSPCGPSTGVVASVVDGDTVELASGEKLRLLLVDTQEVTSGKNECYGAEARDYTRQLVEGKQVQLAYDEAGCTDRFGRTLAYVSVDGREVNSLLVERGFACVLHISPAGDDRADEFKGLQSGAKGSGRGLWGSCTTGGCF